VMIKDNHKAILKSKKKSLSAAVEYLKKNISSQTLIEIEADTFEEFRQALTFNPHIILLDNMDPETVKKCVDHKNTREAYQSIELEVSGSVNIDSIGSYAKTGVDRISVGALTHSIKSIDFSLEIIA